MFNNQKHLFFLILADSGSRDPRVMQEKYELYLEVLEVHPPSLVHLCPPAGPLSKGKSGRKLGPTCFCSGDEGMGTLRPGNILDLRSAESGWSQLQVF